MIKKIYIKLINPKFNQIQINQITNQLINIMNTHSDRIVFKNTSEISKIDCMLYLFFEIQNPKNNTKIVHHIDKIKSINKKIKILYLDCCIEKKDFDLFCHDYASQFHLVMIDSFYKMLKYWHKDELFYSTKIHRFFAKNNPHLKQLFEQFIISKMCKKINQITF